MTARGDFDDVYVCYAFIAIETPVHCLLECKLVDRPDIGPLLGQKAWVGMKIVSYLDNDKINKPETGGAPVYALEEGKPLSIQQLVHLCTHWYSDQE